MIDAIMTSADNNVKSGVNHNVYKGLYPIREVKQYYRREFVNGKPLYICLWGDCDFKTWKYSQHIARHIHLKHIGIKELKCDEKGCEKTFKRPESLVQHQKNHLCGFGIDSLKMKDPNNVCGVKNIKKYYFRELDNDYYVFGCKWTACEFVTNNSGSIRRHVHNQHLCPHSVANTNNSSSDKSFLDESVNDDSIDNTSSLNDGNISDADVDQPMVEIIELDPQSIIPKIDYTNDAIIDANDDNSYDNNAKPIDIDSDIEANIDSTTTGGLYSLKNYSDLYRKVKIDGEVYFKCNCNQFTTKSQISLVRHIWTDIGRNEFDCNVNDCDAKFDNEFSLYKHRKSDHNQDSNGLTSCRNDTTGNGKHQQMQNFHNSYHSNSLAVKDIHKGLSRSDSPVSQMNGNSLGNIYNGMESDMKSVNIKLENFSRYFIKRLVNNELIYECKCGHLSTKSMATLTKHILNAHKGIYGYTCDQCSAQFDDESALFKHKKFDHISNLSMETSLISSKSENDIKYAINDSINSSFVKQKTQKSEQSINGLNFREFYESVISNNNEWFVCKYKDCEHTEPQETDIIEHLSRHLVDEQNQCTAKVKLEPNLSLFFNENELNLPNNIEGEILHMNTKSETNLQMNNNVNNNDTNLDLLVEVRVVDGKDRFACKWNDCGVESTTKSGISRHILNKHLNLKETTPIEPIDSYNESKYWEKLFSSNKNWLQIGSHSKEASLLDFPPPILTPFSIESSQALNQVFMDNSQWLEKMSSMAAKQSFKSHNSGDGSANNGLNKSFDDKDSSLMKKHLNISNNEENILLSCKGLASMSKVRQYYESQVINGEKFFLCKWQRCEFKTKKSQKIAQHINLSHIGVEFKCNKPNCNKVFKNPNTYREHQKNHICGFGIFGYGSKGVIGVCRNENLNRYRERVIIDSKKFYRCKWEDCNAITRYHMAMKRHLHGHVCPYRVNLKLKQNQQVISDMKSDNWNLDLGLGSGSIPSTSTTSMNEMTGAEDMSSSSLSVSSDSNSDAIHHTNKNTIKNNKTTYQCRRPKCGQSFVSNEDLIKHENFLCELIKKQNNNSMNENNLMENMLGMSPKSMDMNETNGYTSIMQNTSIANIEMMANVDKYISKTMTNGVMYYLCIYDNCQYNSKLLDKTIEHIQSQHFDSELNLSLNGANNNNMHIKNTCIQSNGTKRRISVNCSETESQESENLKENSNKRSKTIEIIVNDSNQSPVITTSIPLSTPTATITGKPTGIGINSIQYSKHTINGQILLFCAHDGCEFFTKAMNEMERHANEMHTQLYVCDVTDTCGKQFRTAIALTQHKLNHICGFNIKGRKPTGVCDLDNIRKYRDEVVVDNRLIYPCRWCPDVTFDNRSVALAHIHNKHLCPNRLSTGTQNIQSFNRNIDQRIVDSNRKKPNQLNQIMITSVNTIKTIEVFETNAEKL
ncbi:uncharacterized protein LOC128952057 [Oppia nitens]|uniref:uncharacterized protein LOC128952057 n=1 Tax=Oppia nitens TaxID=1686743 RepID=UPI0023DC3DCB|nr:uncharacterized protein LOC128952057 [Oppia nitens]